jgi:hypothetical protein
MAQYNEILAGRFNRFVQKHFSMKGREGMPTLSADLGMTMNFNSGVENRYLEGWDTFGINQQVPAQGAALFSVMRLRNPLGSGVVGVITRCYGFTQPGAADAPSISMTRSGTTTDLGVVVAAVNFDSRGRPGSSLILSRGNPPQAGGTTLGNAQNAISGVVQELVGTGLEIPLLPGATFELIGGTQNVNFGFTIWWRERALESSEVT